MKTLIFCALFCISFTCRASWYQDYYQVQLSGLKQHAEHFVKLTQRDCQSTNTQNELQKQWRLLAQQWVKLSGIPNLNLDSLMLNYRLDTWPDRRNLVAKRSNALLTKPQPFALAAQTTSIQALAWWSFNRALSHDERCRVLPTVAQAYLAQLTQWQTLELQKPLGFNHAFYKSAKPAMRNELDYNMALNHLQNSQARFEALFNQKTQWQAQHGEAFHANFSRQLALIRWQANSEQWALIFTQLPQLKQHASYAKWQALHTDLNTLFAQWQHDSTLPVALHETLAAYVALLQGQLALDANVMVGFNNQDGD